MQKTYTINGMTCEHCVNAITEEVSAIDGVSKVQVSLASNSMDVTSEAPIDLDTIKAAVDEAGDYTVAAATSLDTAGHPGGECGCGGHHHADSAESGCGCGGHEGHHHSADAAEKHASHGEDESCGCGHHQKAETHSHVFAADGTQDAEPAGSGHKGFLGRLLHH